jgi:ribonuclease BN (tRNA processing enzyme)
MLAGALALHELSPGRDLDIGPFRAVTRLLPHWVPNAGVRLTAARQVLTYTGDSGSSPELAALARDSDLFLAEATFPDQVPDNSRGYLSSARQAARQAADAGARHLMLTHLWPGTDPATAQGAAATEYDGEISVAAAGTLLDLT